MDNLDDKIDHVIRNFNTDLKIVIQAVTVEGNTHHFASMPTPKLVDLISQCIEPGEEIWAPSSNIVLPICKKFVKEGIFEVLEKPNCKVGESKYYFSFSEEGGKLYRPLAMLALKTIYESQTSFFTVFGSGGGGNNGARGPLNRFKTLLAFYPDNLLEQSLDEIKPLEFTPEELRRKIGVSQSTFWNSLHAFYEDGIIQTDGNGLAHTYRINNRFYEYFGDVTVQRMLMKFGELCDRNLLCPGQEFTSSELYKAHFSDFDNHWFNFTLRKMANKGYLERVNVPKKVSKVSLSPEKGQIIGNNFVVPLYKVLNGSLHIEEVREVTKRTPLKLPAYINNAISLYAVSGPNIVTKS